MKHTTSIKIRILLTVCAGLLTGGCATMPEKMPLQVPSMEPTPAAGLWIISATYGSGTAYADVTDRVNDLLRQRDVEFFASPQWLGADPTPGWNKALVIVYEFKGRRQIFTTGENGGVSASALLDAARK